MKDFHVTIKVRNGRLLSRMRARGYTSAAALSKHSGVSLRQIYDYLLMKITPLRSDGEWRKSAFDISSALRCEPEDIWPSHISRLRAKDGSVTFDADLDEVRSLTTPSPERYVSMQEVRKSLTLLSPRERSVIHRTFGLDGPEMTQAQVAEEDGVSSTRVAQIEAKALRLMKHPSRSKKLRDLLEDEQA